MPGAHAQTATSWKRLFEMLTAAFPSERYHLSKDLQSVSQTNAATAAQFADGTSLTGDLLVGAAAPFASESSTSNPTRV